LIPALNECLEFVLYSASEFVLFAIIFFIFRKKYYARPNA